MTSTSSNANTPAAPPAEDKAMSASPAQAQAHRLRVLLTHTLRRTDITLLRLSSLLSTPAGIDSALCTLSYTLTLVHARLRARLTARLYRLTVALAAKAADALLPGETLVATLAQPASLQRLSRGAEAVEKLAGLVSDFRVFVRLWGLLDMYIWARETWTRPPGDAVLKAVAWTQVAVNTVYQVLENGAYLAGKGVLNTEGWSGESGVKRQNRWWVWSSRFWAAHVALEFVRLGWEWRRQAEARASASAQGQGQGQDEAQVLEGEQKGKEIQQGESTSSNAAEASREDEAANAAWWRQVISNVGYAPLTVHWSVEEGVVGEAWVGFFGMVAGGAKLRERWRQTAAEVVAA